METKVDLKNINITYIIKDIKEMYPDMKESDIVEYIEKALTQKTVQDLIVGFICREKIAGGK